MIQDRYLKPIPYRRVWITQGWVLSILTIWKAAEAFAILCRTEGIIPALESAHALVEAIKMAKKMKKTQKIVVTLSGRGDKDIDIIRRYRGDEQDI